MKFYAIGIGLVMVALAVAIGLGKVVQWFSDTETARMAGVVLVPLCVGLAMYAILVMAERQRIKDALRKIK